MASAAELIHHIKNLKAGGSSTDDKSMSDYQWMFIIDSYRSQLIRQQHSKGYKLDSQCIQKLDSSKITLVANPIEKTELYTQDLPKAIDLPLGSLYTFIGTEGGASYQKTTYNKSQWDKHSKYIGKLPKWYQMGKQIVVKHHNKNLKLNVQGVFESPMQVLEFNELLHPLYPFNFEYPMSSTMIDTMIKLIADSELKLSLLITKDNLNDSKDGE